MTICIWALGVTFEGLRVKLSCSDVACAIGVGPIAAVNVKQAQFTHIN